MANEVNSTQCTFMETLNAAHCPDGSDTKINMMARAFKELSLVDYALFGILQRKSALAIQLVSTLLMFYSERIKGLLITMRKSAGF